MRVRLLRATVIDGMGLEAGSVIDVPGSLGLQLIQMGKAEPVRETAEAAVIEAPETAVTPARKRKQK